MLSWCPADREVTLRRFKKKKMARVLQSHKGKRKDTKQSEFNRQDRAHLKSKLKTLKWTMNDDRPALTQDLPPKRLTQLLFVSERRTAHRWKACLLADTKSTRSMVSQRLWKCKRCSNLQNRLFTQSTDGEPVYLTARVDRSREWKEARQRRERKRKR